MTPPVLVDRDQRTVSIDDFEDLATTRWHAGAGAPHPRVSIMQSLQAALGVRTDEVERLFQAFVDRTLLPDDAEWRDELRRRRRKILKGALRRAFLGWLADTKRTEETVLKEYAAAWQGADYSIYAADAPRRLDRPWVWQGRCMLASQVGATRVRQLILIRAIERVRPRSVLEVGSGNGINLLLLAGRFPEIAFTGVELTGARHRAATGFQERTELPEPLLDFAPETLADLAAFRRIRFIQGNARALPFASGEFDLVYSTLALEQMERFRHQALAEMARVTRRHTLMIEPFADVNRPIWARLNVMRRNYFRGRIGDLTAHGLTPLAASQDFPQEVFLKVCAVLAEKRARGA